MRRTLLSISTVLFLLVGCSDDGTLFPQNIVCRGSGDCPTGETCNNGTCAPSGGSRPIDAGGGLDAGDGTRDTGGTDAAPGDTSTLDIGVRDTGCVPDCSSAECGNDGCGGSCGTCPAGESCNAGTCQSSGGGGTDCRGILTCVNENACADQACLEACLGRGTATAQQQFIAVLTCLSDNCSEASSDADFQQCQQDFCSRELNACSGGGGGGGPSGSDTCMGVVNCVLQCPDQSCADACVAAGTPAAQNAGAAYYNCAIAACSSATTIGEFHECGASACPSEAAQCNAN